MGAVWARTSIRIVLDVTNAEYIWFFFLVTQTIRLGSTWTMSSTLLRLLDLKYKILEKNTSAVASAKLHRTMCTLDSFEQVV